MKNHRILTLHENTMDNQPIVLFDGECTLCNSSVHFLLRHNHSGKLRFASLQSETGSEIVKSTGEIFKQTDTLLLLQDNILYSLSTAAIKISAHLCFPWHLLRIFFVVPRFIRDAVYSFIAKNRYKWFGRKSFCIPHGKEYPERFLS